MLTENRLDILSRLNIAIGFGFGEMVHEKENQDDEYLDEVMHNSGASLAR
jgi:hypothetical protein